LSPALRKKPDESPIGTGELYWFGGADGQAAVEPEVGVLGIGIAQALGHARRIGARNVQPGAVGFAAVAVLGGEIEEPAVTELEAGIDAAVQHLAVAFVGLSGLERDPGFVRLLAQDDVDHARDCVRPVLRRCTIAQHFDAVDRRDRNRVDVGTGRTATNGLLHVHQRLLMTALAVH
jgi:hypothetical protein